MSTELDHVRSLKAGQNPFFPDFKVDSFEMREGPWPARNQALFGILQIPTNNRQYAPYTPSSRGRDTDVTTTISLAEAEIEPD
ncbi:MAG: hypothetical protein JW941_13385, partial [Candidatus Coatesbacteria bacterium]|nr:hypothetical protein [Candidatus Coatesbacteria bacterium]